MWSWCGPGVVLAWSWCGPGVVHDVGGPHLLAYCPSLSMYFTSIQPSEHNQIAKFLVQVPPITFFANATTQHTFKCPHERSKLCFDMGEEVIGGTRTTHSGASY